MQHHCHHTAQSSDTNRHTRTETFISRFRNDIIRLLSSPRYHFHYKNGAVFTLFCETKSGSDKQALHIYIYKAGQPNRSCCARQLQKPALCCVNWPSRCLCNSLFPRRSPPRRHSSSARGTPSPVALVWAGTQSHHGHTLQMR